MKLCSRLLACLLCCLLLATPAAAQEGEDFAVPPTSTATLAPVPTITPTPVATLAITTQGIIFSADADVFFPSGVRFSTIILRRPEEITLLSLTIEREGQPAQTLDLDPEEAREESEPNPLFAYFWEFTAETTPRLFEEISYRWTVRSVFNEVNTASGVFQFTDPRLLWQQRNDEGRRFDLTLRTGINIATLGRSLDEVYNLMAANTGERPSFDIMLYDDDFDPQGCFQNEENEWVVANATNTLTLPCTDPSLARSLFTRDGYTVLSARSEDFADIQNVITRHFMTTFYAPFWSSSSSPPSWFRTGLYSLYTPEAEGALYPVVTSAARDGSLLTLAELEQRPSGDPLVEAQSYALIAYIADTFGIPAVYELATSVSSEASFADAYQRITGRALDTLLPALRDWLTRAASSAAFGINLYGAPTATVPPTATFTPFPPTRTPRPEPTITLTPSITFTPTTRPTATPTPSVTPRPPGSLNTATPVPLPTQTTQPLIDTGSRTSILALLLIVMAVLVIILTRIGRR
jgi:hypothetical protein